MFKSRSAKKPKSHESGEDTSWVVEGIVEYLQSPTWNSPVLNFVESHCSSFTHSDESSFDHTELHKIYKSLVEDLLGAYMKELGISEEQFSSACSPKNRDIARIYKNFEYIWAADDFLIFKRLMASHNVRLQQEALQMFDSEHKDALPKKISGEDAEAVTKMLKSSKMTLAERKSRQLQEAEDLHLAIEFSKLEMEKLNAIADKEKELLEQAIRLSLASCHSDLHGSGSSKSHVDDFKISQSTHSGLSKPLSVSSVLPSDFSTQSLDVPANYDIPDHKEKTPSVTENKEKTTSVDKNKASVNEPLPPSEASSLSNTSSLPPLKSKKDISSAEAANAWLDQAMKGIVDSKNTTYHDNDSIKHGSINPEELAKRKAYLQQQRDKLLAQKKKQRNQELEEFVENKKTEDTSSPERSFEEEKKLASRRAIAEKLKREVINKN